MLKENPTMEVRLAGTSGEGCCSRFLRRTTAQVGDGRRYHARTMTEACSGREREGGKRSDAARAVLGAVFLSSGSVFGGRKKTTGVLGFG